MILTCPACKTAFRVRREDLGPEGRKVRCGACRHLWYARAEGLSKPEEGPPRLPKQASPLPVLRAPVRDQEETLQKTPLLLSLSGAEKREAVGDPGAAARRDRAKKGLTPAGLPPSLSLAGAALVLLLALLAALWVGRERLVTTFPEAAILYRLLGAELDPRITALSLEEVTLRRTRAEGEAVLVVEGWIANSGSEVVQLPPLEARLLDAEGQPLRRWSFAPEEERLEAGARTRFRTQVADLREAVSIDIDFLR